MSGKDEEDQKRIWTENTDSRTGRDYEGKTEATH